MLAHGTDAEQLVIAESAGTVLEVRVDEGDVVQEGDVLVLIG